MATITLVQHKAYAQQIQNLALDNFNKLNALVGQFTTFATNYNASVAQYNTVDLPGSLVNMDVILKQTQAINDALAALKTEFTVPT